MPLQFINPSTCDHTRQGLNRLIGLINSNFQELAKGGASGSVVRFKLQSPLSRGGNASADINTFDGDGYSLNRSGVVFDEEVGGVWEGETGGEGWATARGNSDGEFSIIFMSVFDGQGGINNSWQSFFASLLGNSVGYAIANLSGDLTGGTPATITGFDWKGPFPLQGTAPTSVSNPHAHRGLDGDQVLLCFSAEDGEWIIKDVEKKSVTVVLDLRDNGTAIQTLEVTCAMEYGAVPAWVSKITPETCS